MGEIRKHGASGYRRGCRCEACRAGHREAAAAWRASKRKPAPPVEPLAPRPDVPTPAGDAAPGPIETALRCDLERLIGEPPWRGTLEQVALANARVLDQVGSHERYDVLSGLQLRTFEVLDRLRKVDSSGGGVPADWVKGLADPS